MGAQEPVSQQRDTFGNALRMVSFQMRLIHRIDDTAPEPRKGSIPKRDRMHKQPVKTELGCREPSWNENIELGSDLAIFCENIDQRYSRIRWLFDRDQLSRHMDHIRPLSNQIRCRRRAPTSIGPFNCKSGDRPDFSADNRRALRPLRH
jgi:hypothetical protein